MHTIHIGHYNIHFNGDFSGDILVDRMPAKHADEARPERVATIPFMVMLAVVGEKLRREKMAELDDMAPLDVVYKLLDGDSESK